LLLQNRHFTNNHAGDVAGPARSPFLLFLSERARCTFRTVPGIGCGFACEPIGVLVICGGLSLKRYATMPE
jgi:hypothetical protein